MTRPVIVKRLAIANRSRVSIRFIEKFVQGKRRNQPCWKNFPVVYLYHHAKFGWCFSYHVRVFRLGGPKIGGRWDPNANECGSKAQVRRMV